MFLLPSVSDMGSFTPPRASCWGRARARALSTRTPTCVFANRGRASLVRGPSPTHLLRLGLGGVLEPYTGAFPLIPWDELHAGSSSSIQSRPDSHYVE